MPLPSNMRLDELSSRYAVLRERQQQIPALLFKNREALKEQQEKLERAEQQKRLLDLGIAADKQIGLDEREAHHLSLDIKSLKSSILKHKAQIDELLSEDSQLKVIERELQTLIGQKQQQRDNNVRQLMREHLDHTTIETAREAMAELLYYVGVKEGSPPTALNVPAIIGRYLEMDGDLLLSKQASDTFSTRKAEVTNIIIEKELHHA
jgi:hypothetical protein